MPKLLHMCILWLIWAEEKYRLLDRVCDLFAYTIFMWKFSFSFWNSVEFITSEDAVKRLSKFLILLNQNVQKIKKSVFYQMYPKQNVCGKFSNTVTFCWFRKLWGRVVIKMKLFLWVLFSDDTGKRKSHNICTYKVNVKVVFTLD